MTSKLKHCFSIGVLIACLLLAAAPGAWAAFGEDVEKPKPEYSRQDGDWIAKLVPRGKSTAIQIRFHLSGGQLTEVGEMTFAPDTHPQVDPKNFRSDFFKVEGTTAPGAEAALTVSSAYFTSATELWGPVDKTLIVWGPISGANVALADRVNALTINVRDGGPLDADGQTNGHIQVIFGPRDSFWGYALGTLFIRFFGIFLVLIILMIGMNLSGLIFKRLIPEKKPARSATPEQPRKAKAAAVPAEAAAAIAVALHLQAVAERGEVTLADQEVASGTAWSQYGRAKLMSDRMPLFDRFQRK